MCNVGYSQIILSSNELANSIAFSFEWKQSRVSVEEKFTFALPPPLGPPQTNRSLNDLEDKIAVLEQLGSLRSSVNVR